MKKTIVYDYANDATDVISWDGSSDVDITFALGSTIGHTQDFAGVVSGVAQYLALVSVAAAKVTATPNLWFLDLDGVTSFASAQYLSLKLDAGNAVITSDPILIEYPEKATMFIKLDDLTGSGVTRSVALYISIESR